MLVFLSPASGMVRAKTLLRFESGTFHVFCRFSIIEEPWMP